MRDVIVVGTGPAGSTAARILGEHGFDVLALEAKRHPRRKVCGGALSVPVVEGLGIESDDLVEVRKSIFVSPSGFSLELESDSVLAYNLPREQTDSWLARLAVEAGAELREGEFVRAVIEGEGRARVIIRRGEYEARAVVGADGFGSRVAASLGLRPRGWFRGNAFCPVAYVPLGGDLRDAAAHEFHMGLAGAGYAWVFRHSDHLNVGIGALVENYGSLPTEELRRFLEEGRSGLLARAARTGGGEILGSYIPYNGILGRLYSERTLLVGDAGGFVNALPGAGVRGAIKSAELASDVLREVLEEGEPSEEGLAEYQRRCEGEEDLGVNIAVGREMRDLLFSDLRFLDDLLRFAAEDDDMGRLLLDLIYTRRGYSELVREMFRVLPKRKILRALRVAPGPAIRLVGGISDPHFDPSRGRFRA